MLPSTRGTSAANHCAMPLLNGRPILAFLRALVGAFKAEKSFIPRFAGFSGDFSDVTGAHRWQGTSERPSKPHVPWRQSQCRYFDTVWADRGVTPYLGVVAAAELPGNHAISPANRRISRRKPGAPPAVAQHEASWNMVNNLASSLKRWSYKQFAVARPADQHAPKHASSGPVRF